MQLFLRINHITIIITEDALYVYFYNFIIILVCPANPSLYSNFDTKQCVQYCPSGKYALDTNRSCTATCPTYYFVNQTLTNIERKCVAKCPADTFIDSNNFCVKATACPAG